MEFWYQLARRPVVSNDETMHALLLYLDNTDPAANYADRVKVLHSRGMLPGGFDRPGDEVVERGTLAVALMKMAGVKGGVTMQLLGPSPRYAVRALQARNLLPPSSPNQTFSGPELVAVLGRIEDWQRGDPARAPADLLPGEIERGGNVPTEQAPAEAAPVAGDAGDAGDAGEGGDARHPLLLNVLNTSAEMWWADPADAAATAPAPPAPTADRPAKLKVVITGVEGDQAEVRKGPAEKWLKPRVGMSIGEAGEFRTGPKSAIRFVVPPDQVYTLDRQGTCTVLQAVYDGKRVKTDVGMQQGRVRLDVAKVARTLPKPDQPGDEPYQIGEAGIEHGIMIHSPNAALAVRGTIVSLYDEAGFAPEAVSLTGRAVYRNTRRQLVAFGGGAKASVRADQTGAAESALTAATEQPNPEVARVDFNARLTTLALDRGARLRGDVISGNRFIGDTEVLSSLSGALHFLLRWDGGPQQKLNDLNLVVLSPLHTAANPDFVGNPPFALSLTPDDPKVIAERAALYPRTSRSGGQISKNHIGPLGIETASWPSNYPVGTYKVVVYNLLDAVPAPTETVNPVPFKVTAFLNNRLLATVSGSVGELQTSAPSPSPSPPVWSVPPARQSPPGRRV